MDTLGILNNLKNLISEKSRYPSGRGSYKTAGNSKVVDKKSRVTVYPTIKNALAQSNPGKIFSTKGARRLYVVSKRSHGGKDSESVVSGRIAKGFTPGSSTPGSSWSSVKSHAARTSVKYNTATASKLTAKERRKKDKKKPEDHIE